MKKLLLLAIMMLLMSFSCTPDDSVCNCEVKFQDEYFEVSASNIVTNNYLDPQINSRDTINDCSLDNTYFQTIRHFNYGDGSYQQIVRHHKIICE